MKKIILIILVMLLFPLTSFSVDDQISDRDGGNILPDYENELIDLRRVITNYRNVISLIPTRAEARVVREWSIDSPSVLISVRFYNEDNEIITSSLSEEIRIVSPSAIPFILISEGYRYTVTNEYIFYPNNIILNRGIWTIEIIAERGFSGSVIISKLNYEELAEVSILVPQDEIEEVVFPQMQVMQFNTGSPNFMPVYRTHTVEDPFNISYYFDLVTMENYLYFYSQGICPYVSDDNDVESNRQNQNIPIPGEINRRSLP